jgi:hypothetical protein
MHKSMERENNPLSLWVGTILVVKDKYSWKDWTV